MIETTANILAGLGLGVITGLLPGIHLNTVAALASKLAPQNDLGIVLLIVAMNTMHGFVDFIPSILVGAPSTSNFLSALPGHKLFLEGHSLHAVKQTIIGGLIGTVLSMLLVPVFFMVAAQTKQLAWQAIPIALTGTLALLVASEKNSKQKAWAIIVMALASMLGIFSLRHFPNALFPLVTGFFGMSTLIFSLQNPSAPVPQTKTNPPIQIQNNLLPALLGAAGGAVVSFFPAIGPSQAAVVVSGIKTFSTEKYLVLLGSLNAAGTIFSLAALQAIQKARTGSAVAIQHIISLSDTQFVLVLSIILISTGISALTTLWLARHITTRLTGIDHRHISRIILGFLALLVGMLTGGTGLLIMGTATAIGLLCPLQQIKRSHCMAFLIVPTLGYYIGF